MVKADSGKNITVTQGFIDKLLDKISNILKEQYALKEVDEEQAEEIELLLDKISFIERDFEELTKSLAKGSYPLKLARSIKVPPVSLKPQIVPIEVDKSQLINTYNEIPALLSSYINPVSLTPDSYRGNNINGIVLETIVKGNYWAICTQENKQYKYWLVPNNNISFNVHKIKTIENLFQLKGNYGLPNTDFILEEPAILSLLPDNRQWKLIQPGVLFFGSNLKSKSPQAEQPVTIDNSKQAKINEQTLSSLNSFQKTIDRLTNKVTQLEVQSEISQKIYQRERKDWLITQESLAKQLEQVSTPKLPKSELNKVIHQYDKPDYSLKNISQEDLATVRDLKSYFDKRPDIIRRYHLDHYASQEEVEVLATLMTKASNMISKVESNHDLINLFEYLIVLKGKLSKYNHGKYKYRWSVSLENEVISKLQLISILQDYQIDKLDFFLIQQALKRQRKVSTNDSKPKVLEKSTPESKNKADKILNPNIKIDSKTQISQFRQAYTQERKLINDLIVAKVAISVETLEQITFHTPDKIILENTLHGKYWIIDYLGNYFLIPSEIKQITNAKETSLTVARLLFHLSGYYPQYSDYHLIRPAIVTKISANQWELKEKGKFNFS